MALLRPPVRPAPGVGPSARVHPTPVLGAGVHVGALAVVGAGARVGARTVVHPHVVLYDGVEVGEDCVLHSGVHVREGCRLGNRVVAQNGAVVGADGFGFARDGEGRYHKFPQVGIVVIEDDVEIGALTAIDRAALGETRIGRGTKLDNLVQVGHSVTIGVDTVLAGQVGVAGSTKIGSRVTLAGQVGVAASKNCGLSSKTKCRRNCRSRKSSGCSVSRGKSVLVAANWNPQKQAMLEALEEMNLFVIPLDDVRHWYRYHHLFADVLRKRLEHQNPHLLPELHRRASQWYEKNGFIAETIQNAIMAGDQDRAAHLIEENGCFLLMSGEAATLLNWTDAIEVRSETRPWLAIQKAWALALTGDLDRVEPTLQVPEKLLAQLEPSVEVRTMQGTIAAARAQSANLKADSRSAAEYAHQALELLPDCSNISRSIRSAATIILGDASWINGDLEEAKRARGERSRDPRRPTIALEVLPESLPREARSPAVHEEDLCPSTAEQCRSSLREVALEGRIRRRPERNDPLLRALSGAISGVEAEVAQPEIHEFADPKPRRVEDLEHRRVPQPTRQRLVGRFEETIDLFEGEALRERPPGAWRVESPGGVVGDDSPLAQPSEETADRHDPPRHRTRCPAPSPEDPQGVE